MALVVIGLLLGWRSVDSLAGVLCVERRPFVEYLKILVDRDAWVLTLAYMVTFGGYIVQLVPLRFAGTTAAASSVIGEVGALAGALVPVGMGVGREWTGSFGPGFLCLLAMCAPALFTLLTVAPSWVGVWIDRGGRASTVPPQSALPAA